MHKRIMAAVGCIVPKVYLIGAELVQSIALRLKWSNERREAVKSLVLHHMDEDSPLREADLRSRG